MLIVMSMVFPLLQLVVLGYAFGGNVKHLMLAIVDQDHGVPAVRVRELAGAVSSGAHTLDLVAYADPGAALSDLRNGARQRRPDDPARLLAARAAGQRPARRADLRQHRHFRVGVAGGDGGQHRRRRERRR